MAAENATLAPQEALRRLGSVLIRSPPARTGGRYAPPSDRWHSRARGWRDRRSNFAQTVEMATAHEGDIHEKAARRRLCRPRHSVLAVLDNLLRRHVVVPTGNGNVRARVHKHEFAVVVGGVQAPPRFSGDEAGTFCRSARALRLPSRAGADVYKCECPRESPSRAKHPAGRGWVLPWCDGAKRAAGQWKG